MSENSPCGDGIPARGIFDAERLCSRLLFSAKHTRGRTFPKGHSVLTAGAVLPALVSAAGVRRTFAARAAAKIRAVFSGTVLARSLPLCRVAAKRGLLRPLFKAPVCVFCGARLRLSATELCRRHCQNVAFAFFAREILPQSSFQKEAGSFSRRTEDLGEGLSKRRLR